MTPYTPMPLTQRTLFSTTLASPVGALRVFVDAESRVVRLDFPGANHAALAATENAQRCAAVARQLAEYFDRRRQTFELDLAPAGTEFQRAVWSELQRIAYGSTISYAELARRIGKPKAVRAVGAANGQNPIPIVVPCHRVIGADGSLTGFGGGLACKRTLLELEGLHVRGSDTVARRDRVLPFAAVARP